MFIRAATAYENPVHELPFSIHQSTSGHGSHAQRVRNLLAMPRQISPHFLRARTLNARDAIGTSPCSSLRVASAVKYRGINFERGAPWVRILINLKPALRRVSRRVWREKAIR
jgi:hypothetical protein